MEEAQSLTNDKLALAIQQGDTDKMPQLWAQVERLVAWKASRVIASIGEGSIIEFDDLYNSGYFALCDAVRLYAPDPDCEASETGRFNALFMLRLKTAFQDARMRGTATQRHDPIQTAARLDAPIPGYDDIALGDALQSDTDVDLDVISQVWTEESSRALRKALSALPANESQILRFCFYKRMSVEEIARKAGRGENEVRALIHKALYHLRNSRTADDLERCIHEDLPKAVVSVVPAGGAVAAGRDPLAQSPADLLAAQCESLRARVAFRLARAHIP